MLDPFPAKEQVAYAQLAKTNAAADLVITAQPAIANRSLGMWPVALTGLRSRLGCARRAGLFAVLPMTGVAVCVLVASSSPVGMSRSLGHDHATRRGLTALPVAAQGAVSRALGSDDPSYRAQALVGAFRLRNPGQDFVALLGARGIEVRSGRARLHLSLSGYGYGGELRALPMATLRAQSNRVVYGRGGLSEWYVNGPLGLEQGFTLPAAPAGRRTGTLEIALAVSGNVRGSLSRGAGVTFTGPGATALTYDGLFARDARGRTLPARIELRRGKLLLRVDDTGARYPLTIDPLVQQGEKLTATEESGAAGFGAYVALSADGNTALIGGPVDNGGVGAAWVFTRSGGIWTQQAKLTANDESGEGEFGSSVALSSDGNTAVIGGPDDNGNAGAAWVFTRSEGKWTQQSPKLVGNCTGSCPNEGAGESGEGRFGWRVALSSNGNTALIGGPNDNGHVGAAWVFTRSGTTWTRQGEKLTANDENGEGQFGVSVALSSDGNTALIGGNGDSFGLGAAWVFTRSGSTWTQQGEKLTPSDSSGLGADFGYHVALSSDGNTALIGGGGDNVNVGAAWVFTRSGSGSTWTQQGPKLTPNDENGEGYFGWSVALSSDGNTALIGGPGDNSFAGAAWMFTRSGSTWTQQGEKLTASGESRIGEFGFNVALSADANTMLIGGPADNTGAGAAWMFAAAPLTAPVNIEPPSLSVSGSAVQGQTLTAVNGSWTNSPTSFAHQWQRCDTSGSNCAAIPGATGQTYTLAAADVGSTVRVQETASNASGAGAPASSQAVGPVIAQSDNTAAPAISGTAQQGQTLTEANGTWTNGPTSYSYQWEDCDSSGNNCTPIVGATSQTYTLTASDVGHTIRVQETASNAAGSGTPATSPALGPVIALTVPVNTAPPSLSVSGSAVQGQALTALDGSWTNSPTSFAHQWQRCDASGSNCMPILEATGQTYTLTAADVGSTVRVQETASNEAGTGAPASSPALGPVIAPPGSGPPHETRITSAKVKQRKRSASFSFSAQGTVVGFQCELQGPKPKGRHKKPPKAAFSQCSSSKSYKHLRPGTYVFAVRAFNADGADPNPASIKFKLDQSPRVAKRR